MSESSHAPYAFSAECPVVLIRAKTLARPGTMVSRGELVPVKYGIYAPADTWRRLPPWERYLARVHATALTTPGLTFSHESAAALLGLPIFGEPADVHVLRDPAATSGSWAGLRTHTAAVPREVTRVSGMQSTSVAETAIDIARSRHRAVGLAVVDSALRIDPPLSVEQLVAMNETRASSRGRRHARWAIHRGTPLAARALESVSRATVELLGFPDPEPQVPFQIDGRQYFVDLYWRDAHVAGEADGREKYDGRYGHPVDTVINEKRREDRIRRVVHGFARWGWDDVVQPSRLERILTAAGLSSIDVAQPEPLATLAAALRGQTASIRETGWTLRD